MTNSQMQIVSFEKGLSNLIAGCYFWPPVVQRLSAESRIVILWLSVSIKHCEATNAETVYSSHRVVANFLLFIISKE